MPAYKYQTKDGKTKWYANFYYTDWLGEKKHKCKRGFDTKGAAKEYERLFLDKYSKSPTILFSSLAGNYMEDMESRLKPTTLKGKKYIVETKLLPYFGKMQICDIDADLVRRWQNSLIDYRNEKGEAYAETYLHSINSQLSAVFNYAVKYYKLGINPCYVAGSIGKSRAEEMNFWTKEEFEHVMQFEQKPSYIVAFKLLFYSGMREGELLALTPEDFPRDTAIVDVNKNYAVVDGIEYFLTPKTKRSIRKITIPNSIHAEVLEFIDSMCLEPEERIFYFKKGGLYSEFKRMIKRSGDKEIRVHDLRHSHVAMLVNMGFAIEEISRRLGHDSIKTTWDTYSHLYPGTDRELAQRIEVVIKKEQEASSVAENEDDGIVVDMVPGSPLGQISQHALTTAEQQGNEHIRKNNKNIFIKYGIDIESEMVYGYKLETYLDLIAFGDAIIQTISSFKPSATLKDLIMAMYSDAISSCELSQGSLKNLDQFMVDTTIPKYSKLYGIGGK